MDRDFPPLRTLETLNFDNSYARLPQGFYAMLPPTPLPAPYLVSFNESAAALLDLDPAQAARPAFLDYFAGHKTLPGAQPLAMIYAGHQFGHYVPQLGDGRALLLGEVVNSRGERWDLHLKGAGETPFSRSGDGRAVLRSSIREYLCCEAMHGLGIPTTRALCIVGSDMEVYREQIETGAALLRMAPSHVRFGSFELFFYRGQHAEIKVLADYVIAQHYPELAELSDKYPRFLREVVLRTARLMAKWQAVGFAHGVMNTDNMSILGLTLDYGPYGFLDQFDPGYICNHSDHGGRYAFDRQPEIGAWNVTCLAQALSPLMSVEQAQEALSGYNDAFTTHYIELMSAKLGITPAPEAVPLITGLLEILQQNRVDYTIFFRRLNRFIPGNQNAAVRDLFLERAAFDAWAALYGARLRQEGSLDIERGARLDGVNPKYILRNYMAQIAIQKAVQERDYTEVDRLLALLRHPFDEHPEMDRYAGFPPDWASSIEVSCSS
ncbi:MAG: protein adenylyltransferase SelO [Burkholderiales bacterium]